MNSQIEENYLKAIFKLSYPDADAVSTSALATELGVQAATVTDMLKKLSAKKLLHYKKYKGVSLTKTGRLEAVRIVRKHRLWEVFLVQKLGFGWGEVHEVAEQLEHVHSTKLMNKLDEFLGFPELDPHGDPIPSESGEIKKRPTILLSDLQPGKTARIAGVRHDGKDLLDYLDAHALTLNRKLVVEDILPFDNSVQLVVKGRKISLSEKIASNILVVLGD